jgi:MFS family permease
MRVGLASAMLGLACNLAGSGLGPFVAGLLSDFLHHRFGASTLRFAMLPCALMFPLSAFFFARAARLLRARGADLQTRPFLATVSESVAAQL